MAERTVKLVYFAWARERIGTQAETAIVPTEVGTIAELMAWLSTRGPGYAATFANPAAMRAAINQVHAKPEASFADGDEIALFPPVTGG